MIFNPKTSQGYITIATGSQRYFTMALNLALSIKYNDTMPIALLHDANISISDNLRAYFSDTILIENKYDGNANKIQMFDYSPFERTLFLDGDCLLFNKNMSVIWKHLSKNHIAIPGTISVKGDWGAGWFGGNPIDVKELVTRWNIPYIVKTGGGLFFFDKSSFSKKFFDNCKYFYKEHIHEISRRLSDREKNPYADGPLWAFLMGYFRLKPFPRHMKYWFRNIRLVSLMQYAKDYKIDILSRKAKLKWKNISHYESPTIGHFARMRPKSTHTNIYICESNKLREHYGLPQITEKDILG